MKRSVLLLFSLIATLFCRAQVLINESFDATTFPPSGWTVTGTGLSDNSGPIVWVRTTNGGFGWTPSPNTHTGTGMASYNSWDILNGGYSDLVTPSLNFSGGNTMVVSFWLYRFYDVALANDSIAVFVNTSATAGGTQLASIAPSGFPPNTGWVKFTYTIPATYNGSSNYIIFRGKSDYRDDMFLDDVAVYSQTPAAPTVTNNGPLCAGSTLTITATPVSSIYASPAYTLTGPGISPITNSTGIFTIPSVTCSNNGTFSVSVTSGGYTSTGGTTSVTVYCVPTLTAGTITSPTTCGSSTGSLQINGMTASTGYTLQYRKNGTQQTPASITSNGNGSYTISSLTAGTYDSIRVVTSNGCYSNILGPIVISDPNPPATPVLTYGTPLCSGSILTLTATSSGAGYPANTNYFFAGPGGYASNGTSNTATRSNVTSAQVGGYTVYVTVNGCTSATTTTSVSLTAPSAAPIPNNVFYCQNDIAIPLTAQGTNLLWYNSATGGTGSTTAPTPSTSTAGPQTFYVSQSAPCESPRVALIVTVKPTPALPVVASPVSFCQYEVVSPLTAVGSSLLWYATPTGGAGSTTGPTPITTIPGTFFFYVSQTVNGCEGPRASIQATVKPKPAPPVVVSPMRMCQYDNNGPLTAQGQNLKWYTTPTGGVGLSTAPVPNTNYEDSFYYYVTQTVNGCESDRAQIKVVVNYLPNGIIVRSRPWTCAEDTITFWYFGNARPDAIYNWHIPPQATYVSGGGQGPYVVRLNSAGGALIDLQINNKGCLSTIIAQPVTVRPLPVITFVTSKQEACVDQVVNVALNSITPNIQSYDWQGFDGGNIVYGAATGGPYGVSWSQQGTHIITVKATSDECTSHPAYDTIGIHPYPSAAITIGTNTPPRGFCSGDSIYLSVPVGQDPASYEWTPKFYFYNSSDSTSAVWTRPRFSGPISVKVTSIYGCAAQDSIRLDVGTCCQVGFPNAFTPNGDGKNDMFRPYPWGHHDVKSFRVINRWGQVVYESQDERRGWDGTFNGKPQDMGTYYYYFHYKCADGQDLEEKGEFMLMR